jgi:hypothetical protein
MKRQLQIVALQVAIIALAVPLTLASGATWRLGAVRSRLLTKLDNLKAAHDEHR